MLSALACANIEQNAIFWKSLLSSWRKAKRGISEGTKWCGITVKEKKTI